MSKTYTFEDPYYTIEVPVTTVVCALAIPYCLYHAIKGDLLTPALLAFFIVAAVYQVWNVLVSGAYPREVVIDDETISFRSITKTDSYRLSEIDYCHARANARNGRIFLRINHPTIFKGRYWMGTQDFTDGRELYNFIDELECKVHPDGLKAKARRSNEEFLAQKAKKEEPEQEKIKLSTKEKKKRGARSREAALGTTKEEQPLVDATATENVTAQTGSATKTVTKKKSAKSTQTAKESTTTKQTKETKKEKVNNNEKE